MAINRFQLSLDKPLSLSLIVERSGLDISSIRSELELAIIDHYFTFGTRPFTLEFSTEDGDIIKASSTIGRVKTKSLDIELLPKIPGVSLGKCLGLAQESGSGALKLSSNKKIVTTISSEKDYSNIDYFALSLNDSVLTVAKNGLLRKFKRLIKESNKLEGAISLQKSLDEAKIVHSPYVDTQEASNDVLVNRVLKKALNICLATTQDNKVKELTRSTLGYFKDVSNIDEVELYSLGDVTRNFTTPRPDYINALSYARAIIDSANLDSDGQSVFLPAFTLDLDEVFEEYCAYKLSNLLNARKYRVDVQSKIDHDTKPQIKDKFISPDIVVTSLSNKHTAVIDTKNKYSLLRNDGSLNISNSDLYQICYYAKTLSADYCFLLYPGYKPALQYPLRSSESDDAYNTKCKKKHMEIVSKNYIQVFTVNAIKVFVYNIDLAGSNAQSEKSIGGFGQYISDLLNDKLGI